MSVTTHITVGRMAMRAASIRELASYASAIMRIWEYGGIMMLKNVRFLEMEMVGVLTNNFLKMY